MEILIIVVISMGIGFSAGWTLREYMAKRVVMSMAQEFQKKYFENSIKIKIEKDGDFFFAYSHDDHSFMAQGATFSELDKNLSSKFTGKKFLISQENLDEIGVQL